MKLIKQLEKEIKLEKGFTGRYKIQLQTLKDILKLIDEQQKKSKKLIKEISHHRCRAKTGNWCLDCEKLHSEATGIFQTCEELRQKIQGDVKTAT